jgi:hypothetical protein
MGNAGKSRYGILRGLFMSLCIVLIAGSAIRSCSSSLQGTAPQGSTNLGAVTTPAPDICADSSQRDSQGVGNHLNEHIEYFDVAPTSDCFGEWIYIPSEWYQYRITFMHNTPECRASFWFFGHAPIGPFAQNSLPDHIVSDPTKWRVSTNCTVRYFRTS